jgi:hypothetical protein
MALYPFLVLEVGSGPQVPTFRNSTYLDPQVGLIRDLGARHLPPNFSNLNPPKFNKILSINANMLLDVVKTLIVSTHKKMGILF